MAPVVSFLRNTAFRKGVHGNNRNWLAVWVAIAVAGKLRQLAKRDERVVERIVLKPGQTVVIRDTAIPREAFQE